MTRNEILRRFPGASEATIARNLSATDAVSAPEPKRDSRKPLDSLIPGEAKSGGLFGKRAYVEFVVYAIQPNDWDNCFTKPLQDLLVEVGLLDGDDWTQLQGRVIPVQVFKKAEERTEVKIWYC